MTRGRCSVEARSCVQGEEGQDLLATVRGVAQGGPPQHQGVLEHGCRLEALWVRRVLQ